MAVATFDTLKFANTLKEAGVPPQQAEAQARALGEVVQLNFKELVTKDDLAAVERTIKLEIAAAEQRQGGRLDKAEATHKGEMTLIKWMLGVNLTLTLAVLTVGIRLLLTR